MKNALGKKWFLLTETAKFSPRFHWVPSRETRVYEAHGDGYKWSISGESQGQSYAWTYHVKADGIKAIVENCKGIDWIISHVVDPQFATIGTYYKNDTLVGGFYYEIRRDEKDGGEYLHVIDTGIGAKGEPLFKALKFKAANL
jgi:hypothetical protein